MKIYTKAGDKGKTSLLGGGRVFKSNVRVKSYGEIDELIASLSHLNDLLCENETLFQDVSETIEWLKDQLFIAASYAASVPPFELPFALADGGPLKLEQEIDRYSATLPELKNFVLPGGHALNSYAHVTRCICRRAERSLVELIEVEGAEALDSKILVLINRLSDWLFTVSRLIHNRLGIQERIWKPSSTK